MVLLGEKCNECETFEPEDADGFTENPSSLEKSRGHHSSESGLFRQHLTEDTYCYRNYRNWARKINSNIDMWPKPHIFSCYVINKSFAYEIGNRRGLGIISAVNPEGD
ncbi:hypothetical protein HHI36_009747 [Cryptolaemus montrouzieri]|uniref:Uncharacterized protein n=1 Tax=Cryptolaemus montrouzieri TaxID=559131 RepID=A0ABD2MH50_9CUCU